MPQERLLNFNGKWRSYQQRILDSLDFHLRDKKLHIVAAPGAGKTTLGIEVIARIGRPTLILCPTNTIKNQWRERICSSFLQEKDHDIVSLNIREPGYLTVTTYQALLAAFTGRNEEDPDPETHPDPETQSQPDPETHPDPESPTHPDPDNGPPNEYRLPPQLSTLNSQLSTPNSQLSTPKAEEVIAALKAAKVSLLCFDEAHHLRKEWWKALTYLNEHLKPAQTLALTATPPYDADLTEWKRYQELCGEIDEVISIPELVKNGDLCPHQDYICFSTLKPKEREQVENHSQHVKSFVQKIKDDKELSDSLSKMPFFAARDVDIERIFESPEFYVSIASLLKSKGYRVPQRFLALFDARQADLPAFDNKQASVFIRGLLESQEECFNSLEEKKNDYYDAAKRLGLVVNKKVSLDENPKIRRLIAGSLGKMDSIVEIVKKESDELREQLRMVILTDYIRMDDTDGQNIGVVPIWRRLKREMGGMPRVLIGVLCGSLILLPKKAKEKLMRLLSDKKLPEDAVTIGRFDDDLRYVRVTPKESLRNHIVGIITEMFCAGDLTVLVGTQALLGEGWDAPAINSLILSSTVSSYMLSNQMRGRAIRIDRNHPDKVSNIWHLATVDPSDRFDLDQLATRFKGFEAPSYYGNHEITSGIERVLGNENRNENQYPGREEVRRWWKEALYIGDGSRKPVGLATGVQAPTMSTQPLLYTGYKYKIVTFLSVLVLIYWFLSQKIPSLLPFFTVVAVATAFVYLGVMAVKYLRTGTVEGVLKQVALTLLEAMSCQGLLKTSIKKAGLSVTENNGIFFVSCNNLPAEENNLFIQSLQEMLDPVDNPRYLLVKHSTALGKVRQTDYFAVPAILSANKKNVDIFRRLWERYIGKCEVLYTRNLEGRKVLLKARKAASSAVNREKSKRLSKWQ